MSTALTTFRVMMPATDDPILAETADLVRLSKKIVIKTDKGEAQVNERLVDVKGLLKRAKDEKDDLLKPIKDLILNPIDKHFKEIIPPLQAAEKVFKVAIGTYAMKKRDEAKELQSLIEEATGGQAELSVIPKATVESENGKSSVTFKWTFEVTDISVVPVEHLRAACQTLRGKEALDQIIRSMVDGGTRSIEGCRIFEAPQVAVTLR